MSVDPLAPDYPELTTYQFASNTPIMAIDLDGLEALKVTDVQHPNNEGQVGHAKITIKADYLIVLEGIGSLPDDFNINKNSFRDKYSKGNRKLYMQNLPTSNREALMYKNKGEAKKQSGGIYYEVDIQYDYNIYDNLNNQAITLYDAMLWYEENPIERGVIANQIEDLTKIKELNSMFAPDYKVPRAYLTAFKTLKAKPELLGMGFNEGVLIPGIGNIDFNFVILNPNAKTAPLDIMVHETGHNASAAHVHSNKNYKYHQTGLQSKIEGQIYPSRDNTISIINDKTNRKNIKYEE